MSDEAAHNDRLGALSLRLAAAFDLDTVMSVRACGLCKPTRYFAIADKPIQKRGQ
jgi:hypothetical protein